MSYIPDCRSDEFYNEKYLKGDDDCFVAGYDWCGREAVEKAFSNIEVLSGLAENENTPPVKKRLIVNGAEYYDIFDVLEHNHDIAVLLRDTLLAYIEMERDEVITSCIENFENSNGDSFEEWKEHIDQTGEKNKTISIREKCEWPEKISVTYKKQNK